MFTNKFYRPLLLTAILAMSLSNVPAADAAGIMSKVKGAFVATGDALKDTARATGNVIVGSAKMTGGVIKESAIVTEDVFKGTARAGEAACLATGDVIKGSAKATGNACLATGRAVGTTAGAVAGVTGDAITGSARAVGSTAGAVTGATEGALGLHNKPVPATAISASNATTAEAKPFQTPRPTDQAKLTAPVEPLDQTKTVNQNKPVKNELPKAFKRDLDKTAATHVKAAREVAPPVSLSTEGTRISPPLEETSESPSWNVQEPVARSTAFASQYALRTTPLQASPN